MFWKRSRRPRRETTPWQGFVRVLWRMPLTAIPFALFFGTIYGERGAVSYRDAYLVSLLFAYTIGFMLWAVEHFLLPRWFPQSEKASLQTTLRIGGMFAASAVVGTYVAMALTTLIWPQWGIGGARGLLITGMYGVLFAGLFAAANFAIHFYQQALDKVRAEEEMNMARRIQRSFLRETFPDMPGWEVHAVNVSSKQVSGDFYDVVSAGDGAVLLAIADVSGKGVPAALQSSLLQASLRTQALYDHTVSRMLGAINTLLYDSITPGQFATFVLARVDVRGRRLTYSNAGHNHPIVVRAAGGAQMLDKGGVPLGILESAAFEEGVLAMAPGDRVVFFTDGISEAADASNTMYGEEQLERFVAALPRELSARDVTERILQDVRRHLAGLEAGDDMTLLVLQALNA